MIRTILAARHQHKPLPAMSSNISTRALGPPISNRNDFDLENLLVVPAERCLFDCQPLQAVGRRRVLLMCRIRVDSSECSLSYTCKVGAQLWLQTRPLWRCCCLCPTRFSRRSNQAFLAQIAHLDLSREQEESCFRLCIHLLTARILSHTHLRPIAATFGLNERF